MKERYHINEMIMDTSIKIVGLDNEILTISLDLADFYNYNAMKYSKESQQNKIDVGDIAKPLHPYAIYKTLENAEKNTYNNTKIIERKEASGFIEYHFNYGLRLNVFINDKNKDISEFIKERISKIAFINPICFSYDIIGDSNSIPDDELSKLTQYYGYEKKPYLSIFKKEVYINYSCLERVNFSNCEFESKILLHRLKGSAEFIEFHNGINFENCIFGGEVEFGYFVSGTLLPENKYHNNARETNFKNCIFKKRVDFSNSKICNNIYFTDSIFQDSVDFSQCEFEKITNFYGVKFDKAPNFSQAQFKGSLNVVNTNLNFDFESLKEKIEQEHIEYNKHDEKPLEHFANDFRDSFRVFKNALIKDNNLLDASNFHKYELYSKEIELDSKENKTLKDKVEKWQLWFYHKLCDHHTDLLLNLKWLIIAIGLFTSLYFISRLIQDISILESLNPFGICFSIACAFIALILYWFGHIERLDFFASLNAVITLWIICYKPQLIFGIANLLGNIKYNGFENFLITIYTIVIGLIIFSLQKTARKNSIVPN